MDKISDIQFSPDGKDLYFSGIQDGMSRLFKSNEVLYDAETSEIISFRISPNSSDYALLRRDNHYHRRGKDQIIINDQEYSDRFVEAKEFFFSPDSRKLVIVGIQYDDESTDDPNKENAEYIHVYNTQNGEKDISGPYRSIHCPTFNEDGSRLACIVLKTGENNFFLKVDEEEYKLDIASKGRKGEKVFLGLKFSINESDNKEVLEIMTNRNNRIEKKVFAVPNSKEEKEVIRMWRQEGEEGLF
ncbi:hypothetical protein KKC60_05015 [Patescibacteria group bacterium]|nr:hypothetical protein [Patescibacteria group bacterium]